MISRLRFQAGASGQGTSSSASAAAAAAAASGATADSGLSLVGSSNVSTPSLTSSVTSVDSSPEDLPAGWRVAKSRSTGKDYFLHVPTGHRQWERPTEAEPKLPEGYQKPNASSSGMFGGGMFKMATTMLGTSRFGNFQHSGGMGSMRTPVSRSSPSTTQSELVVEVFENERIEDELDPETDPKKFSDRDAEAGVGYDDMPEMTLDEGQSWASDWEIDPNYTATDDDGWTYAPDFQEMVIQLREDLSHASRHPNDAVRRRRWVRLKQGQGDESTSPSGSRRSSTWATDPDLLEEDDDPFYRTAHKQQSGFRVKNVKFAVGGGKDNTKDYQSLALTDVKWLVNESDVSSAPKEALEKKTADLEEQIQEATDKSWQVERELRTKYEHKTRELETQEKKLATLVAQYQKIQKENASLDENVSAQRQVVEKLRQEATDKDLQANEEQRALNAETQAENTGLEEKAKALATARMRYKRDNKALAASVEEAKQKLEQQKSKADETSLDPVEKELKAEMDKVRQLHAKLEAVREHRVAVEEESKALFNQVVERKADMKFQSKKKLETAMVEVDDKIKQLKDEQSELTKKLAQKPEGEELRKLNTKRNDIRAELGMLRERRTMLVAEQRKQDGIE